MHGHQSDITWDKYNPWNKDEQWWMMTFQEVYSVYWNSNVWNCYYKNIQIGFALLIHSNSQPDCSHLGSCCSFVRFVQPVISSTRSFKKKKKNSLSCLHLAICEAGVHGLFDFVSYPQTQRGLPLLYSSSAKGASRRGGGNGGIYFTQVHHCRMDR